MTGCLSAWALERHLLGELPGAADHLAGCDACRARAEAMREEGLRLLTSPWAVQLRSELARRAPPVPRRRWRLPVAAALGLAAALALAWGIGRRRPALAEDEKVVMRFEQAWMDAVRTKDVAALDRILADDFILTDSHGATSDKAGELAVARSRTARLTVFEAIDLRVHLHGDAAVVTGRCKIAGVSSAGRAIDTVIHVTDVLVRRGGRWRAVAAHVSRPPDPPPPR